jgi:hypothetical protein
VNLKRPVNLKRAAQLKRPPMLGMAATARRTAHANRLS